MPTDHGQLVRELEKLYRDLKNTRREVRGDDRLVEDLGIDSLLGQEIVVGLEEHTGVVLLGRQELLEAKTVDDLIAALTTIVDEEQHAGSRR